MKPAGHPHGRKESPWQTKARRRCQGFTLLEMMVAVLVIAIVMGLSIPNLVAKARKDPLTQAVMDFTEACANARELAIITGKSMQVRITPDHQTTHLSVEPAPRRDASRFVGIDGVPTPEGEPPKTSKIVPFSAAFDETVAFDDQTLLVNLRPVDRRESGVAVRFHPNGTCDQFEGIIHHNILGDRRITLEVTTSWAEVEKIR